MDGLFKATHHFHIAFFRLLNYFFLICVLLWFLCISNGVYTMHLIKMRREKNDEKKRHQSTLKRFEIFLES